MKPPNQLLPALIQELERQPQGHLALFSLLLVALIGAIDYLLPASLTLSIFYILPILLSAWFAGVRVGLALATLSASFCLGNELSLAQALSQTASAPLNYYWDIGVRLCFFFVITYLVAALKDAYDREKRFARTDGLTGVTNRRHFQELLDAEFHRAQRYGYPLTMAYIDVDNFKMVNDRYGHGTGDLLLNMIAQVMTRQVRAMDVVARLGGDEFVLLLPQTGPNQARSVLPRVQRQLMQTVQQHGWPISFSIGVATFIQMPESTQELVNQADCLMYNVKTHGKNHIDYGVFNAVSPALAIAS